jgi:hypothetical protein
MSSRVCTGRVSVIELTPALSVPLWFHSSQVDSNMFLVRNRLHIHRIRRNAGHALLSRHYVQPTHTRPAHAPSATPVEKILLDTIKVHTTFSLLLNTLPDVLILV